MGRSPVPIEVTQEVELRNGSLGEEIPRLPIQLPMLVCCRRWETVSRGKLALREGNNPRLSLRSLTIYSVLKGERRLSPQTEGRYA